MPDFWTHLTALEKIFSAVALFSNLILLMQVIGALFLGDLDIDELPDDPTIDAELPVLSMKAITAFFTFFGWTGYMLLRDGHLVATAVAWAVFAGSVALLFTAWLLKTLMRLEHRPEIDLSTAIAQEGEVYLTVPENLSGTGKVHIHIQGTLRELDAKTQGEAISTGSAVMVLAVQDSVLLVKKI